MTPVQIGCKRGLAINVKRADTFWRMDFMASDREIVERHFAYLDWNFANGLHAVAMKEDFAGTTDLRDLFDRK
jgi:hypothetical protein